MIPLLNRTTAPQALRFFDACFKQGVIDACELGNDIEAREFLTAKEEDWAFGVLGQPDDYDWKAFRYWAYWLARKTGLSSLSEYLFKIRGRNYIWCILPYCMRFYLMGVKEWLGYPNPVGIELFKQSHKKHWNPSEGGAITKTDIFSYLHDFEFQYRRLPDENKPVSNDSMSSFVKALFDLCRKYVASFKEDDSQDGA